MKLFKEWNKSVATLLHIPTSIILVSIGLFFSALIFINLFHLIVDYFNTQKTLHDIIEEVFLIFLYIEVIASIKLYFKQSYHFPLRFFLYIGITDLIRRIIIRQDAQEALIYALGLLILVIVLTILEMKNFYLIRKNKEMGEEHFEL